MRIKKWSVIAVALMAVAVGCGDDNTASTSATTTPGGASATTASTGGSGQSACSIDRAFRFVGLAEKRGESAAAIDDFDQGWQLAADQINAAGGVCGQKVEYTRIPTSNDATQSVNAFLQAMDKKADFVSGPISSGPVLAMAPEVAKSGVPVLYMSTAIQALVGNEAGTEWGFSQRPRNDKISSAVADYVVNELGAKKVGLLCINSTYGSSGCDAATAEIEKNGGKVVAREVNEPSSLDLTSQIVALRSAGSEAVLTFNFPNPAALLAKQAIENDLDVPIFGFTSASIAVGSGLSGDALKNLWGTDDCAPSADPAAADFRKAYEAKYGHKLPGTGYTVAEAYDAMMIAKQAVEHAGSLEPKAIADAMRKTTFDGVCTTYKADAGQGMNHSSVIISFGPDGAAKVEKVLDLAS
jgi:branched-chain amino acid transport system substrate-binding protein